MTKKILPVLFSVVLLLFLLPSVAAQAAVKEAHATDHASFMKALNDSSVDKIILDNDIQLDKPGNAGTPGGDASLMIPEHTHGLVIDGTGNQHQLLVHNGGIILGGNTTFQNLTINLSSSVRNGIIANGHTLTLENVKKGQTSAWSIHLFCGTIDGYNSSGKVPDAGTHGQIILKGTNQVGQIFAGNFVGKGTSTNKTWAKPSTIIVEQVEKTNINGSLGPIYGCGASEPEQDGQGDAIFGTPKDHPVTGKVTIQLGSTTVLKPKSVTVNGAAAENNAAKVILYLDGNMHTPTLENLSALEIHSGYFSAQNGLSFASYSNAPKAIKLAQGAKLDLSGISSSTPLNFGRFEGGGILILGKDQCVNFSGPVTGTTQVAIGRLTTHNESGIRPSTGHIYLTAPASTAKNAFHLLPYANNPEDKLQPNEKGEWAVSESGGTKPQIILSKFELDTPQVMEDEVLIPVLTGNISGDLLEFGTLPYKLEVSGKFISVPDSSGNYFCTFLAYNTENRSSSLHFSLALVEDENQDLHPYLSIKSGNPDSPSILPGTYDFKIHIEKKYIQNASSNVACPIKFTIPASSTGYSLGDLHYQRNGAPVLLTSNAALPHEVLNLDVSLTGESGKTVSAFVASYDKDGRMLKTAVQSGTISTNTLTLNLSGALNNTKGNISTVKVFLLDEHNAPLCAAKAVAGLR